MIVSKTLFIQNRLGLHARAAVKLVELAQGFDAKVTLSNQEGNAQADSVMGLLMLESGQGEQITITTEGDEAQVALNAIAELIEGKFEEDE
ncbi:HPr family phosphocarrier protein [Vibrio gallicus]|uniref:HPr family phosphocarrier protein n=1 Tax=Vibrio gallicus TaxID=190897 RepID=UPI0021C4B344|nr:HPr family phosphocarrier protein [Vibrio gallicus]